MVEGIKSWYTVNRIYRFVMPVRPTQLQTSQPFDADIKVSATENPTHDRIQKLDACLHMFQTIASRVASEVDDSEGALLPISKSSTWSTVVFCLFLSFQLKRMPFECTTCFCQGYSFHKPRSRQYSSHKQQCQDFTNRRAQHSSASSKYPDLLIFLHPTTCLAPAISLPSTSKFFRS